MQRRKDSRGRVLKEGESQRKDLTYMYRYYDVNHNRKSVYAKTLEELRKKELEINKDVIDGIYTTDITLNELFDRHIEQNKMAKPRTKNKYKLEYKRWIRDYWIGKRQIKTLVKSDIAKFYSECSDRGLSNGSIKCINKYIHSALEMAVEDDKIRKNVSNNCIQPYLKAEKGIAMTEDETLKFIETAENMKSGQHYLLAFKLMLFSGMRYGEIAGMTWDDIDLNQRIIHIDHQFVQGDNVSRTAYHIDTPKTFKGTRDIPMSDDLFELLMYLKKETYEDAYKFNTEVDGYKGFVIHTKTGLPVLNPRLNEYAKKVVKEYNSNNEDQLPNVTCHVCRRTFCTRLAELNLNPNALQKIMGHNSYKTTAEYYIKVDNAFVNREFNKVLRASK